VTTFESTATEITSAASCCKSLFARLLLRVRIPLRQLGNVRVQKIPGMAARGVEDDGGLERHGTVEASDIDADEFGTLVRLVVDETPQFGQKPFRFVAPRSLVRAISRTSPDISNVARENTRTELCPPGNPGTGIESRELAPR
jgi:hypothetical protein